MVFVNLSKEDRERRRSVLNKLKSIVDQLSEKEETERSPGSYLIPYIPCYSRSCPLPCLQVPSVTTVQEDKKKCVHLNVTVCCKFFL